MASELLLKIILKECFQIYIVSMITVAEIFWHDIISLKKTIIYIYEFWYFF